jgi:hypothetical protein
MRESIKAKEWKQKIPDQQEISLQALDWIDNENEGTGSRILLMLPRLNHNKLKSSFSEIVAIPEMAHPELSQINLQHFTETILPTRNRVIPLINGISIPNLDGINLKFSSGPGGIIWIDLRGGATPRLRADRKAITKKQNQSTLREIHSVLEKWKDAWPSDLEAWRAISLCAISPSLSIIHKYGKPKKSDSLPKKENLISSYFSFIQSSYKTSSISLSSLLRVNYSHSENESYRIKTKCLSYDIPFANALALDLPLNIDIGMSLAKNLELVSDLDLKRAQGFAQSPIFKEEQSFPINFAFHCSMDLNFDVALGITPTLKQEIRTITNLKHPFLQLIYGNILNDAYSPKLAETYPPLHFKTTNESQFIGQLFLVGCCQWHVDYSDCDDWIKSYDLCSPYISIPLAELRKHCPTWIETDIFRKIFILPIIYGDDFYQEVNKSRLKSILGKSSLHLLLPDATLHDKLFSEYTEEDKTKHCASAVWDLDACKVRYLDGVHSPESTLKNGLELKEWLKQSIFPRISNEAVSLQSSYENIKFSYSKSW